jgi:hypothetical protein
MAQHRDPPAYQEYAASMMARTEYRVLSLEGRGLLYTLRNECWVNGQLPADPATLARVLGYPVEQVQRALPELRPFVVVVGGVLRCPELDDYRAHLDDRRERQAAGGRKGAEKTNGGRQSAPPATPPGKPRGGRESLVQPSTAQHSQAKRIEEGSDVEGWLNDYEAASNGR